MRALGHSELSLKAVLQDGNDSPSNLVVHPTHMKESYNIMKVLFIFMQYNKYCQNICKDFKVTALLLGMQLEHIYAPHVKGSYTGPVIMLQIYGFSAHSFCWGRRTL
jgi:hypothetical protein